MTADQLIQELNALENPADAAFLQRFFKTGPGEYGEGDVFIGLRVPITRKVCKEFRQLPLQEIEKVLESPVHEHRLAAVIIMAERAKRADGQQKQALYELYLKRTDRLNNWDIIDVSCRDVVGGYLQDKSREPLYQLARSNNMWERRIAIVSTWQFIRAHDLSDTFAIATMLLGDTHDLIHKATGWMLREAGKKDEAQLVEFLEQHAATMPRTMLRYAIEKFPPQIRAEYLGRKSTA